MKTSFGVDIQLNKSFFNLVLRCHADNRGFGKGKRLRDYA